MLSLQELQALDVGFVSITKALDFTTPLGKVMAGMLAVFAQFERDLLSERVMLMQELRDKNMVVLF